MIGANGERVSASRRKLAQALEQDRLISPQGSPIGGRKRGESSDGRRRHGCERSSDDGQEEEYEEDLGERRLLVASPPLGRKRVSGARPYVGRSPPTPPSGCVQREELREQGGRSCGSRPASQARSCGVKGMRGEEDGGNCCTQQFRSAAEDEKEQMDADAVILPSNDKYDDVTYRGRENDRVRRRVAENFVDSVFDDLSSTASLPTPLSRMSLK